MAGRDRAQQLAQPNPMKTPGAFKASAARTTEDEPHEFTDATSPLVSIESKVEMGFREVASLLKQLIDVVESPPEKSAAELAHSCAKGGHKTDDTQLGTAPACAQTMLPQCPTSSAVVTTTQRKYEDLMKQKRDLQTQSDHLARQQSERSSELTSATTEVAMMQKKYEDLMNENKNLQAKSDNLAEQLSETKIKLSSVTAETGRLRGIVFERLKEQEQSDMEIIVAFESLRQKIQAISRSKEIDSRSLFKLGTPQDKPLMAKLTSGELRNRMRGEVFRLLQRCILDYPCFGLEGFVGGEAREKAERDCANFERCFTDFERLLKESKVSNTAISEWRIASLNCVDQLRIKEQTSLRVAKLISEYLLPIRTDAKSRNTQLDQNILELCKQALELRIKMRKSKESYRCEIPRIGKFAGQEQIAEAEHSEGHTGSNLNIAYTIFGALTKESEAAGRIVLERARVIVH